ncbi:MAG: hypothetical protein E6J20_00705 [Chloroflexi bacterium]|nr:MAG: hypothetical protein E6J20_00705 [Chloroflexota bacterium]
MNNGAASVGGKLHIGLRDADGDGRLVLVGYGPNGVISDLGRIGAFLGISSVTSSILRDGSSDSATDEVAAITVIGVSGQFTITVDSQTTQPIAVGSTAGAVVTALTDTSVGGFIPAGDVLVQQTGSTYLLTFTGSKGAGHVEVNANGGADQTTGSVGVKGTAPDITVTPTVTGTGCRSPPEFACLDLPIFVGTDTNQVPIDFLDGTPGEDHDCPLFGGVTCDGMTVTTTQEGSDGTGGIPARNEKQTIAVYATSGSYTLSFGGKTTGNLAYGAGINGTAAGTVQWELEQILGGSGNVTVTVASVPSAISAT